MEISKLYERVTFQKNSVEIDSIGNHKNVWRDYFTCHAYPSTYTPDESERAGTIREKTTIVFTVRYCKALEQLSSVQYRVLFRSEVFNIRSIDWMNYDRKTIKVECEKERDRR